MKNPKGRRKAMKIVLRVLGSLSFCFAASANENVFTLAFSSNPPFAYEDSQTYEGIAVKAIRELFKRSKLKSQFQMKPLIRSLKDAKYINYSCAFPVQRSQNIESEYQWISPIFVTTSSLYALKDSKIKIKSLIDAKDLEVGALLGNGDAEYLKSFGFTKVSEVVNQEQNIGKLNLKRIEIWATDIISAQYFTKNSKYQKIQELFVFRKSLGSLACNNQIPKVEIDKLQKNLDLMIQDGSWAKLTTGSF